MSESGDYFDQVADRYDEATRREDRWTAPVYIYQRLKDIVSSESRILDIGIGTGNAIDSIYQSNQYLSITGVDASEKMLAKCGIKYPDINLIKIDLIQDLNSIDQTFDLVICSGAVEFIKTITVFFQQCQRLLVDQGMLCFTYEPLIDFHPIQKDRKTLTMGNLKQDLYVDNCYTYRYPPIQVFNYLNHYGFRLVSDEEFIAYSKHGEPIIYHLIQAVNNG